MLLERLDKVQEEARTAVVAIGNARVLASELGNVPPFDKRPKLAEMAAATVVGHPAAVADACNRMVRRFVEKATAEEE